MHYKTTVCETLTVHSLGVIPFACTMCAYQRARTAYCAAAVETLGFFLQI